MFYCFTTDKRFNEALHNQSLTFRQYSTLYIRHLSLVKTATVGSGRHGVLNEDSDADMHTFVIVFISLFTIGIHRSPCWKLQLLAPGVIATSTKTATTTWAYITTTTAATAAAAAVSVAVVRLSQQRLTARQ
jgi:hypothetical protein